MRFLVPRYRVPVGFGQTRTAEAVAGVDDGDRLFAVAVRGVDPDPDRGGSVSRAGGSTSRGWVRCRGCWSGTVRARSVGGGGGRVELTAECQAFRGTLGAKVLVCRPADPEAKGLVERVHDYLERSFLPGRTFTSPADFNTQLQAWLDGREPAGTAGRWAAPRRTGSPPTGRRCCRCRRSRRRRGGAGRRGCRVTTTSAWTATTTRCTRR